MKRPPDSPEFERFTDAMRHIMRVPKAAIQRPKETGKRLKTSASRVSGAPSKRAN
ncbi:MAG: hypothetical protein WA419_07635 [Silvibacterium sp.]